MRARLAFAVTLIATLIGASALPSHAASDCMGMTCWSVPMAPATSAVVEPGPDVSRNTFVNQVVCVGSTLDPAYYPVAAIAQQWNAATNPDYGSPVLSLDFSTNCAGDGYTPSHRMTIGIFSNSSYNGCLYFTNTATVPASGDSYMNWWTQGPGIYINIGISGCVSTAFRRSHQVAAAIGWGLGLNVMTSSGYASRVMCTCSLDTLRAPTSYDGNKTFQIFTGVFG